jgi:tRNA (adenine57-N1/adenine58-N1)-methyltransferase catalytic subunit
MALSHRTQILYSADISTILMYLEVGPGSIVYESGTGSGSLSYAFINAIAGKKSNMMKRGHLFTFEFNAERVKAAKDDFEQLGIIDFVTVTHRDVVKNGFKGAEYWIHDQKINEKVLTEQPLANAIFLDLPMPWEVVKFADECLVENGKFCSFSPCIEQVQRTCLVLAEFQYTEITTVEVLNRSFDIRDEFLATPNFGGQESTISEMDFDVHGQESDSNEDNDSEQNVEDSSASPAAKISKISDNLKKKKGKRVRNSGDPGMLVSHPFGTMRGHTGYLTFARKHIHSAPSISPNTI